MLSNLILLAATAVGIVLFYLLPGPLWSLGPGLIVLAWIVALVIMIPYKPATVRGRWAMWACFAIITAIATSLTLLYVQEDPIYIGSNIENIHIEVSPKVTSIMIGLVIGIITTVIFFASVGYFSSIYILSLHEEDLTFWEAYRSFVSLIRNIQFAWLKVEDGEVIPVKEKGFKPSWLSLGKIMIRAGNAIVLQKGGTITRVHGPGTLVVDRGEEIKQVFDLKGQSILNEVTNAITADRIPLSIKIKTNYRLKPAEDPEAKKVIKEKNFGFFPVDEATLLKATFSSRSNLEGFAKGATEGQLRDQIMAHRFDELFEIGGSPHDHDIRVNSRRIKVIEDKIRDALTDAANNSGLVITGIDISEIHFPEKIRDKITEERISQIDAKAIVTRARAKAQEMILKGQGEGEARAAFFREVLGELKKENGMANTDMVASIIRHLIDTMVSVQDLKSFVRATALMDHSNPKRLGAGSEEYTNGNGAVEHLTSQ